MPDTGTRRFNQIELLSSIKTDAVKQVSFSFKLLNSSERFNYVPVTLRFSPFRFEFLHYNASPILYNAIDVTSFEV